MKAGDTVWFRQTCRGGYGFQREMPAVFVRATPARVTIRVQWRDDRAGIGGEKQIIVHPKNVRPRADGTDRNWLQKGVSDV